MQYYVVNASSISSLMVKVEKMCAEGWKPQGGICVDDLHYFQAMIKKIT